MSHTSLLGRYKHANGLCCSHRGSCPTPRLFVARATKPHVQPDAFDLGATRQQLADDMLELERVLPTLSCSQLASTLSSIAFTYKAAHLSCHAEPFEKDRSTVAGSMGAEVINFYTSEFPDQSWLLTFRASVSQHLLQHPASLSQKPGAFALASSIPGPTAAVAAAVQRMHSGSSCTPAHLAKIVAALANLPIMVVQPLPIGFGTPRWYRPLAAADPSAWEAWLADLAAVYSALLQDEMQHAAQQTAAAAAVEQRSQAWLAWLEQKQPQKQSQSVLDQVAEFVVNLACAMRWANVNVNDDRLQTPSFKQQVLDKLQEQLAGQQQHNSAVSSWDEDQQQHYSEQQQLLDLKRSTTHHLQSSSVPEPIAGSVAHRITYTMLMLLLPPPRPLLDAFFEATAPQLSELFSIPQLIGLVRGLLFLGAAPSEPWLRALVDVVRFRAQELPAKEVQGFVEGFRFFGTKVRKAGYLRDATAQLEEFTLC